MPRRLAACLLPLVAAMSPAADPATGFLDKTFNNADGTTSPYVLFVPHGYDGKTPVPVILFLHGAGESKGGSKMPIEQGIGVHIKSKGREKTFPAIVIIPHAEAVRNPVVPRWHAESPDGKRAIAMLDEVSKEYKVDPARVYLTGLSMGGYGTWSMAAAYPDKWAAIVPICGGGKPEDAAKFKDVPCWVWHGDQDGAVKVEKSREMVQALKDAGGKPRYTELEWVGHNSWDPAYACEDLYQWLFAQKKTSK